LPCNQANTGHDYVYFLAHVPILDYVIKKGANFLYFHTFYELAFKPTGLDSFIISMDLDAFFLASLAFRQFLL
jgi:hypothetical protein